MNEAIARLEREARRQVATAAPAAVSGAPASLDASHVVAAARVIPERGEAGDGVEDPSKRGAHLGDKPPNGAAGG
jgi:hypothetical protein